MAAPANPKLYHIAHVDRLPSMVADGWLWCDAEVARRAPRGTTIGMDGIKQRRLTELTLASTRTCMLAIVCRSTSARARSCCTCSTRATIQN